MTTKVIRLTQSQLNGAVETLALAFKDDPLFRYFCGEDHLARLNTIQWFSNLFLRYSLASHHIYTTQPSQGVAIWLPPGCYPLNEWRLLQLGLYALPFKLRFSRFWQLFNEIEKYHKQDMPKPHWYLFMLGVNPAAQGQGIGGLLLQPALQQADANQRCCCLETSTERAVQFYQKHGFEVVRFKENSFNTPSFWTMKRLPKPITVHESHSQEKPSCSR
ncbi:MAG: GNAT family N-acetyltransferase [Tildeniella nuda ZEHNDER 1965/U140]|nr:GNAT family N-acetyltransferase [Tildeniella nuda ZEHNDER 1965/U140]